MPNGPAPASAHMCKGTYIYIHNYAPYHILGGGSRKKGGQRERQREGIRIIKEIPEIRDIC